MSDGESPAGVESSDGAAGDTTGHPDTTGGPDTTGDSDSTEDSDAAGPADTPATDLPGRFEAVGIVIGCVVLGTFLAPLFAGLVGGPGQHLLVPFALALGVIGGALIAYYDVVTYETVWSFTLGTWLAGTLLSVLQDPIRIGFLVVLDTHPTVMQYRVGVLVVALLLGYATSRLYAQLD